MNKYVLGGLVAGGALILGGGLWSLAQGTSYDLTVLDPMKGSDDAPVIIEEYADFQCPGCKAAAPTLFEALKEYPTQVKFVYKDFPLPMHDKARPAAIGALCAAQQGKFFEFYDSLFASQDVWAAPSGDIDATLQNLADEHGLNKEDWGNCRQSRDARQAVEADVRAANQMELPGTPTFFVNGEQVDTPGSVFAWIKLINAELEKKGLQPENTEEQPEAEANQ